MSVELLVRRRLVHGFHVYHLPLEFGWKCLYNQFSNWICLYHLAAMQNGPMIYATVIPLMRPEIYLKSHISRDEGVGGSWYSVTSAKTLLLTKVNRGCVNTKFTLAKRSTQIAPYISYIFCRVTLCTLPKTNIAPENRPVEKEIPALETSVFRCELLVLGNVTGRVLPCTNGQNIWSTLDLQVASTRHRRSRGCRG